jgi:glycine hydroxymethyltransferase
MPALARRRWLPARSQELEARYALAAREAGADTLESRILALAAESRTTHERDCVNLNPATNTMNPKAEALLSAGLGHRPSLGYAGEKYEMGLEAIEEIEVIAAELAAEVFDARYVETRVASGTLANLYAFMAVCQPGSVVIHPPSSIGGHVSHQFEGAAGHIYLRSEPAPVDPRGLTIDVERLAKMAREVKPRVITIGGSLNLFPHPVGQIRSIADEVGAIVVYDAAHMAGMIAGDQWQQPLAEGAHIMTMSTYKSLGGPASGLLLTNDAALAERIDRIAFPGMTANADAGRVAARAVALLDWKEHGTAYARAMAETARALATALAKEGLPVFAADRGGTRSHQLALEAGRWGGGHAMARLLRRANILSSGIGLPIEPVAGGSNGLRLGVNEMVRWGMGPEDTPALARLMARVLVGNESPEAVAGDTTAFRRGFTRLQYVR